MMNETPPQFVGLTLDHTYVCPVCRHGQLQGMVLMDAFACSFCRHIFTVNLEQQILKLADSPAPLAWLWTGRAWRGKAQVDGPWGWGVGFAIALFALLPTAIVGGGAYYFPPLPGSPLAWLPPVWIILTFLAHLACIIWLMLEYYQIPIVLYLQAIRDRFFAS